MCGEGISVYVYDRVKDTVLPFLQVACKIAYAATVEDGNWERRKKLEMTFAEVSSYKACTAVKIVDTVHKTFSIEIFCI